MCYINSGRVHFMSIAASFVIIFQLVSWFEVKYVACFGFIGVRSSKG